MRLTWITRDASGSTPGGGSLCEEVRLVAETSSDMETLTLLLRRIGDPDTPTAKAIRELLDATTKVEV